jgi:anti-sigma regulatory factor (Ser/Thr protein kinase)
MRTFELRVPVDPGLSVTVRIFVAESARRLGLGEGDIEDLRLAVTELLANAIASEQPALELSLRVDGGRWVLRATGSGPLRADPDGLVDRGDLLRGLAEVDERDGIVELSSDITGSDTPD